MRALGIGLILSACTGKSSSGDVMVGVVIPPGYTESFFSLPGHSWSSCGCNIYISFEITYDSH